MNWCGGMTELRRIGALAAAYDMPVIPHGGGLSEAIHFVMATTNSPWAEMFMPPPGGPKEVYECGRNNTICAKGRKASTCARQTGPALDGISSWRNHAGSSPVESGAIPRPEIGRGIVRTLRELQDFGFRRSRRAHIVVHQKEFPEISAIARRIRT